MGNPPPYGLRCFFDAFSSQKKMVLVPLKWCIVATAHFGSAAHNLQQAS